MAYHQLSQEQRYCITAQLISGCSQAEIARVLGRHPSTIGRELRRNVTHRDGKYRAEKAHSYAVARRRRCRRRAHFSAIDMAVVARLIRRKWSPEQINGELARRGRLRISHETIYRRIRWDKRAGGDLWRHTRIISKFGRKRYRSVDSRGVLPGKRAIAERPAEVELRQTVGHWEGDTVMGSDKRHCILTLVERKTGFAILKSSKLAMHGKSTTPQRERSAATVPTSRPSRSTTEPSFTTTRSSSNASRSGSTSPPRTTHGSVAATKTSTACFANTYPGACACETSLRLNATRSPTTSTPDHANATTSKHRHSYFQDTKQRCTCSLNLGGTYFTRWLFLESVARP